MKFTLLQIALLATSTFAANARAEDGKPLYVLVTSSGGTGFRCQLGTESIPAPVVQGHVRLKVSVGGAKNRGPYRWRLPLYTHSNGSNDIAAAQVGVARPDGEGIFFLDVPVEELDRAAKDQLSLEVFTKDGARANCTARVRYSETMAANTGLAPQRAEAR